MLYEQCVTAGQLADILSKCPPNTPITLFGEGQTYPVLMVQNIFSTNGQIQEIELGGGWIPIDYSSVEDELLNIEVLYE